MITEENLKFGRSIGSGKEGVIYRALDLTTGAIVAVKKIPVPQLDKEKKAKMEEEFKLVTSLHHLNIINCLGFLAKPTEYWLVMEYANLGNIQSLVSTYGKLEEQTLVVYLRQILKGIAYLHKHKVIHRDLKPSNILLNNEVEVKLADFGCSSRMEESQTKEGLVDTFKGSIPYMAPELLRETLLSRKSDIWSIGCTVLEMATGVEPWSEHKFDNYFQAIFHIGTNNFTPAVAEDLSSDIKDFVSLCLKRDPRDRPSAEELLSHKLITKYE